MKKQVDVMCIGHIDKGRIVTGGRSVDAVGGAVYYGGIVLRTLGLRVAVVTRLAEQDMGLLDELKAVGAEVYPIISDETSGIENIIPDPNSDKRTTYLLGFAGAFRIEDLPPLDARVYYIGSIVPDEEDTQFLEEIAARGPIALDVQGFLRKKIGNELVSKDWPEAEKVIPLVHYLKVDNREAAALTGETDLHKAAEILRAWGAKEVVLTHQKGVLVSAGEELAEAPFRPRSLAGRTGRGDTCFSSYFGRRLLGDSPQEAVRFAAALTTLKLERPGPFRGSLEEVQALMRNL